MGTQTMGSNVPEYDEFEGEGQGQGQGQGPLYNLTLEEVVQQLGDLRKPLNSMNLDEFLKSFWTPKANQGISQLGSASATASSGLTLSKDLGTKTVDELWQDIQGGQRKKNNDNNGSCDAKLDRKSVPEKQHTLGEMTLEDFLVKAGIVTKAKKNPAFVSGVNSINPQQAEWMNYEIPPIQQQHVYVPGHHHLQPSLSVPANPIMDAAYPETQMMASPSSLMGTLSDTQTAGRKRGASGDVIERSVERRQKRMIKNRESAARSRARKQAYTHELENKVSRLEEENERLKRQKELEKFLPCELPPEPKYQLRRTTSALF